MKGIHLAGSPSAGRPALSNSSAHFPPKCAVLPGSATVQGNRGGSPTPEDEQRVLQQMRAEGLMAADGAGPSAAADGSAAAATAGAGGAGGPPPKDGPGTRRIRREVFYKAQDGSWQKSHEIVYVGRDRPGQLHSLYQARLHLAAVFASAARSLMLYHCCSSCRPSENLPQ